MSAVAPFHSFFRLMSSRRTLSATRIPALLALVILSLPAGAQEYRIDSEQNVVDGKLRVSVGAKIVVSAASSIPTSLSQYPHLAWSVSDTSVAAVSQINPWVQWVEGKKDGVVTVTFDAPDPAPPNVRASREVIVGNGVLVAVTGTVVAPPANVAMAPAQTVITGRAAPAARGTAAGRAGASPSVPAPATTAMPAPGRASVASAAVASTPTSVSRERVARNIDAAPKSVTEPDAPAVAATGLIAYAGYGNVQLTWRPAAGAAGYSIARTGDGAGVVRVTGEYDVWPDTVFFDRTVKAGVQYVYFMQTVFRSAATGQLYFPPASTEARVVATPRGALASMSATALQPGDMLLYVGQTPIMSPAIIELERLQLGAPPADRPMYSHAGIYLGEENGVGMVAEMLSAGYVKRSVSESLNDANLRVDVYRRSGISVEQQQLVAHNATLLRAAAVPYAWDQIGVLSQMAINPIAATVRTLAAGADALSGGRKAMICSEMVRWAYALSGLDPQISPWPLMQSLQILPSFERQVDYTTPNMLARSGSFQFVYRIK